jgi:hypothetical protein
MAGPDYKPDEWNKPDIKPVNNCYNYAANNKFSPKPGEAAPLAAQPGKKKGIEPYIKKAIVKRKYRINVPALRTQLEIEIPQFQRDVICDGVAIAAKADGLTDTTPDANKKPTCPGDCWLVAYYRRAAAGTDDGDFHFVRQDSDGGWSHMPEWGGTVTRNKYDPGKQNYDKDDPIKDPEHDNVGRGYEFCGYLCCCKNVTVASLLPGEVGTGGEVAVAVCTTGLGRSAPFAAPYTASDMQGILSTFIAPLGIDWVDGFGDGRLLYRIDLLSQQEELPQTSIFVTDSSYTVWDGAARHLNDPEGAVAKHLDGLLGRVPESGGGSPHSGTPIFTRTLMIRRDGHRGFVIEGPHTAEHWAECCIKTIFSRAHGRHRTAIVISQAPPLMPERHDLPWGSEVLIYPDGDIVIQVV